MEFSKDAIIIIKSKLIIPRMKERNINTNQLSKLTGISQPFLSQWMSGDTDISLSRFLAILAALEINPLFVPKELDKKEYEHRIFFN